MPKELAVKVIAMPKDSNADGDMFGGWIISMMDLAGATLARKLAGTRIVTVAIDQINFHLPVEIGDYLECFVELVRQGNSSMTVKVEAVVQRKQSGKEERVTEGVFTYVAIDGHRRPVKVKR